jgi:hypothetical protein
MVDCGVPVVGTNSGRGRIFEATWSIVVFLLLEQI